jgi:hypothetical protein
MGGNKNWCPFLLPCSSFLPFLWLSHKMNPNAFCNTLILLSVQVTETALACSLKL